MKKLILKSVLGKGEVLTRGQLKQVLGGAGSGGSGGQQINCNSLNLGTYECFSGSLEACETACYNTLPDCTGCS
jgi:hypothetical protein